MARVLVTGGTDGLGRDVVVRLLARRHRPRVLTRRASAPVPAGAEVAIGDLTSGAELNVTLDGVEAIIHCASDPRDPAFAADLAGTRELLGAAQVAGAPQFIYISIVGVGQSEYPYYVAKRQVETLIAQSTLPWTILRTTQFHQFALRIITGFAGATDERTEQVIVPEGMRLQSVDRGEIADRLIMLMEQRSIGRAPDMGGPQILTIEEMTREYLRQRGRDASVVAQPLPGVYDVFKSGINLAPDTNATGVITWRMFLRAEG